MKFVKEVINQTADICRTVSDLVYVETNFQREVIGYRRNARKVQQIIDSVPNSPSIETIRRKHGIIRILRDVEKGRIILDESTRQRVERSTPKRLTVEQRRALTSTALRYEAHGLWQLRKERNIALGNIETYLRQYRSFRPIINLFFPKR